jgi:hypothetical protein
MLFQEQFFLFLRLQWLVINLFTVHTVIFLGTFAYSRKASIKFVVSVLPSISLSASISSALTRRIFVKFGIGYLYENLSVKSRFG